jgi:FkbM family methyltransferase
MQHWLMRLLGNTPGLPLLPSPWLEQRVTFVDVGARGGPPRSWLQLTDQIEYICFEPDAEEARDLKAAFSENRGFNASVSPKALGAIRGSATLNLTKFRPSSSLLPPNLDLLRRFAVREFFEVEETATVGIDSLDSALEELGAGCDFLKADVQGYELEVLRGAEKSLASALGCELEVSFLEIYRNQPLFAEVDTFMRQRGFFLADLERVWWRHADVPQELQQRGSMAYGNALYLRTAAATPQTRQEAIKAMIICIASGLDAYAFELCEQSFRHGPLSADEHRLFMHWFKTYSRGCSFWHGMASFVSGLPGRQTLGRWLGLWSRALQGHSHTGSDSESWLRRSSW